MSCWSMLRLASLGASKPLAMRIVGIFALAISLSTSSAALGQRADAPLGFMPNRGQFLDQRGKHNQDVAYLYQGGALRVQLRTTGFSFELIKAQPWKHADAKEMNAGRGLTEEIHRVDVEWMGADPAAYWEALEQAPDPVHFYTAGTGTEGITNVPHYAEVICHEVYPNIDIVFRANDEASGGLKYDWVIRPGGDPERIRLRYTGGVIDVVERHEGSGVRMQWADGVLHDDVPRSYWLNGDHQRPVLAIPVVRAPGEVGFVVEGLEDGAPAEGKLVIDPIPELVWGTYYGAPDSHGGSRSVAIDTEGNVLMAGQAALAGLATLGAHDVSLSGSGDALLVKFGPTGQRLWSTYYGGTDWEAAHAVAADASNNIYIAGETWSTNAIATLGAHQTSLQGETDAFLVKFNANGTRIWGTYFGGTGPDYGYALTIDGADAPVIGGSTFSNGMATTGASDMIYDGTGDGFVAKFNANGVRQWSTYLGGGWTDQVTGLTNDGTFFFAAGRTASPSGIATPGTHDTSLSSGSSSDGFLVKYSGLGQKLWGTYYGGAGLEYNMDCVAEQGTGVVYLSGTTSSTSAIATPFAYRTTLSGPEDGFLARFNSYGTRLWGTYAGGSGTDQVLAVAFGAYGRIVITGNTDSPDGIATSNAHQTSLAGSSDAWLSCFNTSGNRLWGSYFGGTAYDGATDVAVQGLDVVITGNTLSNNGIATPGAFEGAGLPFNAIRRFLARFSTPLFLPKNSSVNESVVRDHLTILPVSDNIEIRFPSGASIQDGSLVLIRIVDMAGRATFAQSSLAAANKVIAPWSVRALGAYVVEAEIGEHRWTGRVVIDQ